MIPCVFRRASSLAMLALLAGVSACRISRPAVPPAAVQPAEEHCWWAAYRTDELPDAVVARVAAAFVRAGLPHARQGGLGDTAWAQAGPPAGSDTGYMPGLAARVVAFRRTDTTVFRIFVGSTTSAKSLAERTIPLCGDILRAAALRMRTPREEEAEDSLPRWRRRG